MEDWSVEVGELSALLDTSVGRGNPLSPNRLNISFRGHF